MSKEIMLNNEEQSPMALISMAVAKGSTVEEIGMLMGLAERFEANQAKKAYVKAMSDFKKHAPKIIKDGEGHNKARYASLANVVSKVVAGLSAHGLSHTWTTKQEGPTISVTCTITHEMGHSESTTLSASPDATGSKNAIQAIGSTITYLERYTLTAATGLAAQNEDDDDGESAAPRPAAVPEKPFYPQEKFQASWPTWKAKIESGENTSEALKIMLRSKYTLTDEQIQTINSVVLVGEVI